LFSKYNKSALLLKLNRPTIRNNKPNNHMFFILPELFHPSSSITAENIVIRSLKENGLR
jgi:uncharacterized protein (DUF1810 family)